MSSLVKALGVLFLFFVVWSRLQGTDDLKHEITTVTRVEEITDSTDLKSCTSYVLKNQKYFIVPNSANSYGLNFDPGRVACEMLMNPEAEIKNFGKCFLGKINSVTDDYSGFIASNSCSKDSSETRLINVFTDMFIPEKRREAKVQQLEADAEMAAAVKKLKDEMATNTGATIQIDSVPFPMSIDGETKLCKNIGPVIRCN